jgi:serine/threonine-protein kinase
MRDPSKIDTRTDVWSLGCIFYELLAGYAPFVGDGTQLMLAIARGDVRPLSQLRPELPREIDQIIAWALAKDRDQRFESVYALAYMLRGFASRRGQLLIDQIGRMAHGGAYVAPNAPLAALPADRPSCKVVDEHTAEMMHGDVTAPPSSDWPQIPAAVPFPVAMPFSAAVPAAVPAPVAVPSAATAPSPVDMAFAPTETAPADLALAPMPAPAPVSPPPAPWEPAPNAFTESAPALSVPPMAMNAVAPRRNATLAALASVALLPLFALVMALTAGSGTADMPAHAAAFGEVSYRVASAVPTSAAPTTSDDASVTEGVAPDADTQDAPEQAKAAPQPARAAARSYRKPTAYSWPKKSVAKKAKKKTKKSKKSKRDKREVRSSKKSGTLAAVAIGRNCTFFIDGVSRGMRAKVTAKVSPGKHRVSCRAADGTTRSRTVNVTPGRAAVAAFRF